MTYFIFNKDDEAPRRWRAEEWMWAPLKGAGWKGIVVVKGIGT